MTVNDRSLTVEEAAALLGVSVATVRRKCASGELPARKLGRSWVVDGQSLPRPTQQSRPRRVGSASSLVDLGQAITHVSRQDLRRDVWVPDVLLHEDDLSDPSVLIVAASDRIDGNAVHDPAVSIPVPKSPFFPRNSINLSLIDRLAYHAVVAELADLIEKSLSDSVYSARLSSRDSRLLANGRDGWLLWRRDITAALSDGSDYMVSTDVTAYFDFVKHEILIPEVQQLGVDTRLIAPLRRMLKEWATAPNTGIPQGPDASRVLGNFYMAAVDHVMVELADVRYFRFMDDVRIVGRSRSAVIEALQVLDQECRRRGLALSTKKTELLVGESAVDSMAEPELDAAQYAFETKEDDDDELRKQLAGLFRKAIKSDGTVRTRWARFSLSRLFQMRDRSVLSRVLGSLENLAPLGDLVPKYLHPWMRRPATQRRITEFLANPERNTSPYLSTWLMAVMLDIPDAIPDEWVSYARRIALDKAEPSYHRTLAINVLVLGGQARDLEAVRDIVKLEHDPEVVRAALVALKRGGGLTREMTQASKRIAGLQATADYLASASSLPSLVFRSRRNQIH